jgi:hypothetical protein
VFHSGNGLVTLAACVGLNHRSRSGDTCCRHEASAAWSTVDSRQFEMTAAAGLVPFSPVDFRLSTVDRARIYDRGVVSENCDR